MTKILVAADDHELLSLITNILKFRHGKIEIAEDGVEASAKLRIKRYDLVILDWALPKMTGVEVCHEYRSQGGRSPIILLTAPGNVSERIKEIGPGANDYICKPPSLAELNTSARACLSGRKAKELVFSQCAVDLFFDTNNFHHVEPIVPGILMTSTQSQK